MSAIVRHAARATTLAAVIAFAGVAGAQAAVISVFTNAPLSAAAYVISPGGGTGTFQFTSAATGNGPGAAVATTLSSMVTNLVGVTDFSEGSTIDQAGELYNFSAFPSATLIPNSPAVDYIGIAFNLADGLHFGYAEVAGAQLTGYAFESVAGASIVTADITAVPEPASVALLLAGLGVIGAGKRTTRGSNRGDSRLEHVPSA